MAYDRYRPDGAQHSAESLMLKKSFGNLLSTVVFGYNDPYVTINNLVVCVAPDDLLSDQDLKQRAKRWEQLCGSLMVDTGILAYLLAEKDK